MKVFKSFIYLTTFFVSLNAFSQTPGMIYEPATGGGAAILDPNGDGYTSATTTGFSTDDQIQSEIPYSSLIFPGSEPTSDLNNAPDCGFTDFVDQGDRDPAQKYLSPAGNWLFRLRMGSISPNAKSYSILIDTDGKFGNTGANADPQWTVDNPGFEIEIVLATKFGVFVYNCNNPCTPVISYPGTTNYQKSIAGSTNCGDLDYFLDFYVVFAQLVAQFPGIDANTPMRYVIVDNTAAQASTICQPNSASDVGGVGQCTTLSACFNEIIDAQAFCSPNTSVCTYRSDCPTITQPISSGAVSVSGTSSEVAGSTIRVYENGTLIGSTLVQSNGSWTLTGISLSSNDTITATAQAVGEFESVDDCSVAIVGSTCSNPISSGILSVISGNKGVRITFTAATLPPVGTSIYMYNPDGSPVVPSAYSLVTGSTNPIITSSSLIYNFECQTGQCFPAGTYYFSIQRPGQCNSTFTPYCLSTTATTAIPSITTSPITSSTTTISGTVPSPNNVAGVSISVYVNGVLKKFTTTGALGNWTATNLVFNPCDTVIVRAAAPTQCISAASTAVYVIGGQTTAPIINTPGCVTSNLTTLSGTSVEANGTSIQIFVNGNPVGSPTTVSGNAWTVTGLNIASGSVITAKATAPCKTQSNASIAVSVATQSANTGLTITTSPVLEQGTTLSGTGINGTQVQVYIDGYPIGPPVTVSGGVWTLTGIQSYELYPYGVLTATATSSGGCPSAPITGDTVDCIMPSAALTVNPASAEFCTATGTVTVQVSNSQTGMVYQLFLADGTTQTGSSLMGNGGTLTLTSGTLSASTTLKVKAFKLPPGACYVFETDVVPVIFGTNPTLSLAVSASPSAVCSGGSSTITIANSQTGYSYQLRNNADNALVGTSVVGTGSSITISTGIVTSTTTYNVLVTGPAPALCSGQLTNTATLTVNANPVAPTASTTVQPTCAVQTGTVVVSSPAQGTGFEYSLDGGAYQTFATFTGVTAGSHTVKVKNTSTTCESPTTNVTVNAAPSAPSTPSVSVTQPTCAVPSGTITFTSQSGVQYSIGSGYQASNIFSGLTPGSYSISVRSTTDNTCITSGTSQTVNAVPSAPTTPTATVTQPTCAVPSGTITFTSQSGVEYSVGSGYQSSNIFSGLTPGSYSISVRSTTDNTCITTGTSQTVNAVPSAPTTPTATVTQPTCAVPSGTITFTSQSGVQYSIGSGYQASNIFSGLTPGTYSISVRSTTDNTCITTGTSQIVNAVPTAPTTPTVTVTQPTCAVPSGTISFTSQSGVQYSIGSGYQASTIFSGLTPGSYTISVRSTTDNTCITSGTSQTVNAVPSAPSTPVGSVTSQPTCAAPTGTIVITSPTGATIEYSINGSTYQSSTTFSNVSSGTYNVTARSTVDNTCISSALSLTVNSVPGAPSVPTASATIQPTCASPSGQITVSSPAFGSGLEYILDGLTSQTSNIFNNVAAGTHQISVINTTTLCESATVPVIINSLTGTPSTPSASVTQPTCLVSTGTITVTSQSNVEYSVGGTYQSSNIFSGLTEGTYSVVVRNTSDNSCTSGTFVIVDAAPLCNPTAVTDSTGGNEDSPITLNTIQSNDSDVDGNVVASTIDLDPSTPGQQTTLTTADGIWSLNTSTGSVTFTPNENFNGTSTISYTIQDNAGLTSNTANLIVTVIPVNDPPIVDNDSNTVTEDGGPATGDLIDNGDNDPDGTTLTANTTPVSGPSNGTITINSNGTYSYTPDAGFNGQDTIVVTICDNGTPLPAQCINDTLIITVTPVNDPPVVDNDANTIAEDGGPATGDLTDSGDSDPDGTTLTANTTPVSGPLNGTITINSNGTYSYTPDPGFNGQDTIVVTICDNGTPLPAQCVNDTLVITVTPVNDPPVVDNDANTITEDGGPATGDLTDSGDSDPDGTTLTANTTPVSGPSNGTIIINSNGTYSYTPDPGFNGQDTIVITICDNGTPLPAQCINDTLSITVTPINDAPNAVTDNSTTNENTPVVIDVTSNDTDSDGNIDETSVNVIDLPSNGSISVDIVTGEITYIPNTGFTGSDTLIYQVCDNGTPLPGMCDTAMVIINVLPCGNDLTVDCDGDGVINGDEIDPDGDGNPGPNGTNPNDPCSFNSPQQDFATVSQAWLNLDCDGDGVTNGDEIDPDGDGTPGPNGTDPNNPCSLNLADQTLTPSLAWLGSDCDEDGVTNGEEVDPNGDGTPGPNGTDPSDPCSFNIADQDLATVSQTWLDADCDGDGVTNGEEVDPNGDGTPGPNGTDPSNPCSFNIADQDLATVSQTWLDADCDGDGVTNGEEVDPNGDGTPGPNGTDPSDPCSFNIADQDLATVSQAWLGADCDGDGVTNGEEVDPNGDGTPGPNGTDPSDPCSFNIADLDLATVSQTWLDADCDGDGVTNGDEVDPNGDGTPGPNGTDPSDPCSFNLADQSVEPSQAWLEADCDGDGLTNGEELAGGSDPSDPCDPNTCNSDITIPQAFTPDGDNTNDLFVIPSIENYPKNKLTFFNRWGNEVFYEEGYNNTWNGTPNRGIIIGNDKLPTGTYYYILDLNGDGETIYKGYVYLKR